MSRAEMRRAVREAKKKKVTYTFTQEQLDAVVAEKVREFLDNEFNRIRDEVANDTIVSAMRLTLGIPLVILMKKHWKKSYKKRLPAFVDDMLEMFNDWQDGKIDMKEIEQYLWEYGGVRLEDKSCD